MRLFMGEAWGDLASFTSFFKQTSGLPLWESDLIYYIGGNPIHYIYIYTQRGNLIEVP